MPKKNFIHCQEDFVCEVCGTKVKGTGYTNHCPNCLYSKPRTHDLTARLASRLASRISIKPTL